MEKLIEDYVSILAKDDKPSTKFWALENKMNRDVKSSGVIVEMRKSQLPNILIQLVKDRVISVDDLEVFSEPVRTSVKVMLGSTFR